MLRNWLHSGVAGGRSPRAPVVTDDPVARIVELERRLHSWCQGTPPMEYENAYYAARNPSPTSVEEKRLTLH